MPGLGRFVEDGEKVLGHHVHLVQVRSFAQLLGSALPSEEKDAQEDLLAQARTGNRIVVATPTDADVTRLRPIVRAHRAYHARHYGRVTIEGLRSVVRDGSSRGHPGPRRYSTDRRNRMISSTRSG